MDTRRALFLLALSALVILMVIAGRPGFFASALAAPPKFQTGVNRVTSLSALAFAPVSRHAIYAKDTAQQLLTLDGHTGNFGGDETLFVLGLTLPDESRLTGLTAFGQDFDPLGEVRLRLKRCNLDQPACLVLAEVTSDLNYNAGAFAKGSNLSEYVQNNQFTYFLELQMTALANSGLRSVKLDMEEAGAVTLPSAEVQRWEMSGTVTVFPVVTGSTRRVARICTDDLSQLPNPTHYPSLVVDGLAQLLAPNTCVDATGYNIELRRQLNTGPSSGTYQILR